MGYMARAEKRLIANKTAGDALLFECGATGIELMLLVEHGQASVRQAR